MLDATTARNARVAFQRFGLGPLQGGPVALGPAPTAAYSAVAAELNNPSAALIANGQMATYAYAARQSQLSFNAADAICQQELRARLSHAMRVKVGFVERLVWFWSNHFSMSINKDSTIRAMLGQVERDVIRKHVLGNFTDMLLGVMQHPAMICYLDNQDSMGPNSVIGQQWNTSYNENLAREIMELHTLGVGGGYTQADVTSFAKVLTGWSYVRGWEADNNWNGGTRQNVGQFIYRDDWHEPGAKRVLGKVYGATGQEQGIAVLKDLAAHPATAEHLAYKLVCHFITDQPTPEMVNPVASAFTSSGGSLKAMAEALIQLPAAWSAPLTKIRTPYELWIAQLRAFGGPAIPADKSWILSEPMRALYHLPWEHPTPDGYPDESWYWQVPDGLRVRQDASLFFYDVFGGNYVGTPYAGPPADQLGVSLFDREMSSATITAIRALPDQRRAMSILMMTPEFQRR